MRVGCMAVVAAVVAACSAPDDAGRLSQAEALCLDERYEDAIPVLKSLLRDRPLDAGAHYYLGLSYMLAEDFRPVIAKGEFRTALRLYKERPEESPIPRFEPTYFEMMCHVNMGKTTFLEISELLAYRVPRVHIEAKIEKLREYADAARAVAPDAEEVAWLDGVIRQLEAGYNRMLPTGKDAAEL